MLKVIKCDVSIILRNKKLLLYSIQTTWYNTNHFIYCLTETTLFQMEALSMTDMFYKISTFQTYYSSHNLLSYSQISYCKRKFVYTLSVKDMNVYEETV